MRALTVKLADIALAGISTEAGTCKTVEAELEREMALPPVGAALDKVTVQVVLVLAVREVALHCREERVAGAINEIVVGLEELLTEAVTVAV